MEVCKALLCKLFECEDGVVKIDGITFQIVVEEDISRVRIRIYEYDSDSLKLVLDLVDFLKLSGRVTEMSNARCWDYAKHLVIHVQNALNRLVMGDIDGFRDELRKVKPESMAEHLLKMDEKKLRDLVTNLLAFLVVYAPHAIVVEFA